MSPEEVDKMLKQVMLKDLRIQCRARGLSPAGGKEQLSDRLKEHMLATQDL
jgi:SPIRAL1-like protein